MCGRMMMDFWTKILPEWLTAIGTVGAIFSALWLATRDDRIRLRVNVGVRTMVQPGLKGQEDLVAIYVTNLGRRQAIITTIEWISGSKWQKKKQRHFVQIIDRASAPYSNTDLPATLGDGVVAAFYMPLNGWLDGNSVKLIGETENPQKAVKDIQIKVYTSTGVSASQILEKSLQDHMVKSYREQKAKSASKVV